MIQFSENVQVTAEMLSLVAVHTGFQPTISDFVLAGHLAIWRFSDWAANDMYLISLSDDVMDADGDRLDGE